jgi:hypothetical protein
MSTSREAWWRLQERETPINKASDPLQPILEVSHNRVGSIFYVNLVKY